jgi:hypothetical protein
MSSISMPRSSTAAAGGELSITAFYYSSLVFNLRTVPVMSNLLLCRRFLLQGNKSLAQDVFTLPG